MTGERGIRRPGRVLTALLCALTAAGLYGCSGSGPPEPAPTPTTAPAATSPFTGLPARAAPVLAVKIDNVGAARPQTGLGAADLVYVEQVEGGQTRLLAVFSSRLPDRTGPVRSARESDIELLAQFGTPALAYSGSQTALKPLLRAAPLHALPQEEAPAAFVRSTARAAPHNLYLLPGRALAAAPGTSPAHDIGFRFGPAPGGGTPVREHTVRYPAARYGFTWSAADRTWRVAMDGRPAGTTDAGPLKPSTVVVQYVDIHPSRFHDVLGSVSPYTETVGTGTALVLRDGRAHEARWSRPSATSGTAFTTPDGGPLAFEPGQVWVLLAPEAGRP
ncbi:MULTISPECIES: DUF3048 domain-containing protein [Streptomyces]|uniref:Putative secreted protein n=2 Tax=Streptomyces venezuelae TaxID=54571 RepID=F2RA13_STRVP|nr:DUF3048 domain-containing protein [Streptomyces venezuelae]APE20244.1 CchlO [Streptomyces venezuelae]QER97645.1 DUF3048 domain-containing protein [Streptomyces venezuelae ATCC 10712]CCA54113.1 putative secreted protein [Streptomyces venezuelae ATCC 10712]